MMTAAQPLTLRTIRTQIPARLDRLPWSRFHWQVVAGLGTVWILDGLEVTMVGSIGARLTEPGSGINMNASAIGTAAAVYVAGACVGALFFGQLTDRHGRKRLMMLTLALYVTATVTTAFAFAPWFFYVCRFFTGGGIGGEYAAINSAIDELIPARNRGQADITINGSYWVGSGIGGLASLLFLDEAIFARSLGWRLVFATGAVLGVLILLVRRTLPESPRWLFIHGRDQEAERIVSEIEERIRAETGRDLDPPRAAITVRQRAAISFREIARVALKFYPNRMILGLALFVGQAFLYNAVTFNLGNILNRFFGVASGTVPVFIVIFAASNFLGPLFLGRLFDTVGRKPMITGTYLISAGLTLLLAVLLVRGGLSAWSFIAVVGITFFFASAGASSAYLTVSEVFPMETRALAIALFYAVGTAVGGVVGPLLFGNLIDIGVSAVATGFFVGAAVMAVGGIAELIFGVRAEGMELENIAKPITVVDAERAGEPPPSPAPSPELSREHVAALRSRQAAEEERSRAAEHRAAVLELRASAAKEDEERARTEQVLAEIADLRAQGLDEQAAGYDERAGAAKSTSDGERKTAHDRAEAAQERYRGYYERAEALAAEQAAGGREHAELAEAALARARAKDRQALAATARAQAAAAKGIEADIARVQAAMYDEWSLMHAERARAHEARAKGDKREASRHDREADVHGLRARAADERVSAVRYRAASAAIQREEGVGQQTQQEMERAAERDKRIRRRLEEQARRERSGLRRFLPGPGRTLYSPAMIGTAGHWALTADQDLDREIDEITRALNERGPTNGQELTRLVGAQYWGPGRFRAALREAQREGRVRRTSDSTYGPSDSRQAPRGGGRP